MVSKLFGTHNQLLTERGALLLRLTTGLFIGLLVGLLIDHDSKGGVLAALGQDWREILAQSLTLLAFVLWANAAVMRRISLAAWTGLVAVVLIFVSWHAQKLVGTAYVSELAYVMILLALSFIANELVSSADQAGKIVAPYELYFDEAWKRGVQLALAIFFTLLFWAILILGAALLGFIGFNWLKKLLDEPLVATPLLGLAFASAVHLGDIQPRLLTQVRALALGVLGWLLPVISLIGVIFAVSLLFSGLQPLWDTRAATATLLSACIAFVLLINAAFQQGEDERKVALVLKWSVRLGCLLLLLFAVLAAWSLSLRIFQYGLTIDRAYAAMVVVIALAYGVGYSIAVFKPGPWMAGLKPANIGLAMFKCVVFLAVLTPVAAPARLCVDHQVRRLLSGHVKPERFDWFVLSADTGQYGKSALAKLVASKDPTIASWAQKASDGKLERRRYDLDPELEAEVTKPADLTRVAVVSPKGAKLPASFIATNFHALPGFTVPRCLMFEPMRDADRCHAALINLDASPDLEVAILSSDEGLSIFKQSPTGWIGLIQSQRLYDEAASQAFKKGEIRSAEPVLRDIILGDTRLRLTPVTPEGAGQPAVLFDATPLPPSKP